MNKVCQIIVSGPTQTGKTIVLHRIANMMEKEFGVKILPCDEMVEDDAGVKLKKLEDWQRDMVSTQTWVAAERDHHGEIDVAILLNDAMLNAEQVVCVEHAICRNKGNAVERIVLTPDGVVLLLSNKATDYRVLYRPITSRHIHADTIKFHPTKENHIILSNMDGECLIIPMYNVPDASE